MAKTDNNHNSAGDIIKEITLENLRMLYVPEDQQKLYKQVMAIALRDTNSQGVVAPSESLKAIELLWNRMHGLPKATSEIDMKTNNVDLSKLTDDQLANLVAILSAARGGTDGIAETPKQ